MSDPLRSYDPFYILDKLFLFIRDFFTGHGSSYWSNYILEIYYRYKYDATLLSFILSSLLIIFIIYVIFRINRIYAKQRKTLNPPKKALEKKEEEKLRNEKWDIIEEHIKSENSNDWRLAILEADIALGEMLDKLGYRGESIGEQLKSVDKSNFTTIDDAWEAHKIRNLIAHEGASFLITDREAKRVISLFKKVFDEFEYV